jgi:cysteine synthase A
MIDLRVNGEQLQRTIRRAKERRIIIPTFAEQAHPDTIPDKIRNRLKRVGLWEVDPLNLFRITWKNEPKPEGGTYGHVNYVEIPSLLSGVTARIYALVGKWFPTGSHKVGATFGCLVPRLVTGQFDPTCQKAVWPSTGNFCRGGAYDASLLACESIAVLPEEMSRERFDWLNTVAGEVIATPGCESNVKEIYDKCAELRRTREDVVIFNQFEEFGNYLWHYHVTGQAMEEILDEILSGRDRFAGVVLSTGSAGTLACGDYLKEKYPASKIAAVEALQCPTLLLNGYGGHRIEGIGDKHVPWIHNVRNTDMVIAVDDSSCMNLVRLLNEPDGHDFLARIGLSDAEIKTLPLLGISSISNVIAAIKFARYYELTDRDVIFTVLTDSMELYSSRLVELRKNHGSYTGEDAIRDYHRYLMGATIDHMLELSHFDRRRIHNLKYFTWVEQQGRDVQELDSQWYDHQEYWGSIRNQIAEIDELIRKFNEGTGLLRKL